MKTISQNLLDEITQRLVAELEPERIILFGSHAWGQPNEDSDLDLLIIVTESNEPPTKRTTRADRSLIGMGVSKDILVYTRAEVDRHSRVYASLISEVLNAGECYMDETKRDLEVLIGLAKKYEAKFSTFLNVAVLLTPYATAFRYPGDFLDPTREQFDEALSAADRVWQFVLSVLPAEAHP
jgi:predicted nucleotidyltransferase